VKSIWDKGWINYIKLKKRYVKTYDYDYRADSQWIRHFILVISIGYLGLRSVCYPCIVGWVKCGKLNTGVNVGVKQVLLHK
jgi:hypothetical protein